MTSKRNKSEMKKNISKTKFNGNKYNNYQLYKKTLNSKYKLTFLKFSVKSLWW